MDCHFLVQRIFPTEGLNPCLLISLALASGFLTPSATWDAPPTFIPERYNYEVKDMRQIAFWELLTHRVMCFSYFCCPGPPYPRHWLSLFVFCFMFCFFGHEACGISSSQLGIKFIPPALEGEVLTTGPSGRSLGLFFLSCPSESTDME